MSLPLGFSALWRCSHLIGDSGSLPRRSIKIAIVACDMWLVYRFGYSS